MILLVNFAVSFAVQKLHLSQLKWENTKV
jgi:hypothetical protein